MFEKKVIEYTGAKIQAQVTIHGKELKMLGFIHGLLEKTMNGQTSMVFGCENVEKILVIGFTQNGLKAMNLNTMLIKYQIKH